MTQRLALLRHPALMLAMLALLLRLLIPAGMMPAAGTLVLCTAAGAVNVTLDSDGHPVKVPAAPGDQHCAFTGLANALLLPELAPLPLMAMVLLAVAIVLSAGLRLGEGLGRPPRPATGPPAAI